MGGGERVDNSSLKLTFFSHATNEEAAIGRRWRPSGPALTRRALRYTNSRTHPRVAQARRSFASSGCGQGHVVRRGRETSRRTLRDGDGDST